MLGCFARVSSARYTWAALVPIGRIGSPKTIGRRSLPNIHLPHNFSLIDDGHVSDSSYRNQFDVPGRCCAEGGAAVRSFCCIHLWIDNPPVAIQCDHTDKSLQRQQKDRADAKYLQRTWGKDVFVVNHRRGDSEVILHGARLAKERHLDIFECTLPSKAARVPKWSASNKNLIENR